jgi:hypothetical protein
MTQTGRLVRVSSTDGVDFTAAAAQDVALQANLPIQSLTRGRDPGTLRTIVVLSSVQRAWEVSVYGKRNAQSVDPNEDSFLGRFTFAAASGKQDGGAGLFRYYVDGLTVRLLDDDDLHELHLVLVSRDSAKGLYSTGEHVRVQVEIEPVTSG